MKIPKIEIPGKPQYQKLGEDLDFFQVFRKIENQFEKCFLLESLGEDSQISRYSLIGFDPEASLFARNKELVYQNHRQNTEVSESCENPYYKMREIVPQNIISRKYAGGLVGYIGYDAMNYFENSLDIKGSEYFSPFSFGVYKDGLVLDKMTGELFYFHYNENRLDQIKDLINSELPPMPRAEVEFLGDVFSQEEHKAGVESVKKKIIDGLIFQCEVGFQSHFKIKTNHLSLYSRLREVNPSPHMYYLKDADQIILGASPELLFRLRNGEMETFPLAGTTKRGTTPEEDTQLARSLLNDPKEIAEHNMLVDLHRNDLGRVAEFGTVKVRSLMDIKRFSHVQHISSEIVGIIAENEDMFSALASNFPAGTLTGAPKIEAMKIIDELEPIGRGPYGGALGQFCFNGDCTFAIPIRSLFCKGEHAYAQTCGGNVYDSTPEGEYEEIKRKLAAMKKVLEEFKK